LETLRDEWIEAIREGCSRHYQDEQEAEYDEVPPDHVNGTCAKGKDSFQLILQVISLLSAVRRINFQNLFNKWKLINLL